jgi:hypothetical protein
MALPSLTFKEIKARPVICKLTRPAVARIGAMTHLPIILIDLLTEEGIVGVSQPVAIAIVRASPGVSGRGVGIAPGRIACRSASRARRIREGRYRRRCSPWSRP